MRLANATVAATRRCRLCGGTGDLLFVAIDRNKATTSVAFRYFRCTACGVIFLADVPSDIGALYPADYYGASPEGRSSVDPVDTYRIGLISRYSRGRGHLVDVGAGWGSFARQAAGQGYATTAVEMNERACRHLATLPDVTPVRSNDPAAVLRELSPSAVISMWHSIEHMPDPWRVLRAAAFNLEPGGVLVVATPNPSSLQFRLLGRRWAHVDAPRHLFLIAPSTLARKATELGLTQSFFTTADPEGQRCDRLGWVFAFMTDPAHPGSRQPSALASRGLAPRLARIAERIFWPLEKGRSMGSAYTSVFTKPGPYQPRQGHGRATPFLIAST
jgi:hypothetical protein